VTSRALLACASIAVVLYAASCGLDAVGTGPAGDIAGQGGGDASGFLPDGAPIVPGGDASGGSDAMPGVDGGGNGDASDGGSGDAGGPCANAAIGTRVCVTATASGTCGTDGGLVDRTCPPGVPCIGAHCTPPADAGSCSDQGDCSGGTFCDFFVVDGGVVTRCVAPMPGATGGLRAICTASSQCKSGFCSVDGEDGSHVQCLSPCGSCGGDCHPIGTPTTIEGAALTGFNGCYN